MGTGIDHEQFDERDYPRFAQRLEECLSALGQLLERPGFGAGPATAGAELEVFLVDSASWPWSPRIARRRAAITAARASTSLRMDRLAPDGTDPPDHVEIAIRTGQRLTEEQKAALIAVYRSMLQTEPAQDLEPAFRDRAAFREMSLLQDRPVLEQARASGRYARPGVRSCRPGSCRPGSSRVQCRSVLAPTGTRTAR
jgi:hypothetical protein